MMTPDEIRERLLTTMRDILKGDAASEDLGRVMLALGTNVFVALDGGGHDRSRREVAQIQGWLRPGGSGEIGLDKRPADA